MIFRMPKIRNKALQKVVTMVGGQSAMARLCGVKQPTVFYWLQNKTPPLRVLQIEKIANGLVSKHELRPDLYPEGS